MGETFLKVDCNTTISSESCSSSENGSPHTSTSTLNFSVPPKPPEKVYLLNGHPKLERLFSPVEKRPLSISPPTVLMSNLPAEKRSMSNSPPNVPSTYEKRPFSGSPPNSSLCGSLPNVPFPGQIVYPEQDSVLLLERRPFRPFKSAQDYLYAMREDLAEWLNGLYGIAINAGDFFEKLENGVILCEHANNVTRSAEQHELQNPNAEKKYSTKFTLPTYEIPYRRDSAPGSFFARDNIHNFIKWCRDLGVHEVLMFETDDLVLRKNEKHVILALLEIARRGARFGMPAPLLIQMEDDIDREIEKDRLASEQKLRSGFENQNRNSWGDQNDKEEMQQPPNLIYGPQPQVITNDLRSLDEMVRDLVERCQCPSQFPMIKVSEGKYRIGDTKVLIFVRILRNHVMVRVGGGWDTLHHYLDKHDPCRCKSGHRFALSSKIGFKTPNNGERSLSSVTYERMDEGLSSPSPRRKNTNGLRRDLLDGRSSLRRRSKSPSYRENSPVYVYSGTHSLPRNASRYGGDNKTIKKTWSPEASMTQLYIENSISSIHNSTSNLTPKAFSNIPSINSKLSNASPIVGKIKPYLLENTLIKKSKSKSICGNDSLNLDKNNFGEAKDNLLNNADGRVISRSRSTTSVGSATMPMSPKKQIDSGQNSKSNIRVIGNKSTWHSRSRQNISSMSDYGSFPNKILYGSRGIRSASASPALSRKNLTSSAPNTPCRSPKRLNSTVNNVPIQALTPIINKISDLDTTDDDTAVLAQLEGFVNNYRAYVLDKLSAEGRTLPPELADDVWCKNRSFKYNPIKATPRKCGLGSRIPAPVF